MISDLDDKTYDLLFGVRRSVRYHERRQRFYEIWNSITVALGIIGGSAAVAAIMAEWGDVWSAVPAAIVAFVSAVDLAVGTGRRGNSHSDLARQFIHLEQRIPLNRSLENDEHADLTKERLRIEAGEPPVLRLLDVMCHYEVLRSLGDSQKHPSIPWWRRKLANLISQTDYALRGEMASAGPA